jgi:hypothetical protein
MFYISFLKNLNLFFGQKLKLRNENKLKLFNLFSFS